MSSVSRGSRTKRGAGPATDSGPHPTAPAGHGDTGTTAGAARRAGSVSADAVEDGTGQPAATVPAVIVRDVATYVADVKRQRRRLTSEIKDSLRELGIQLSLLNHQVGARLELKDVDFDCLDIINRYGPLSPSALARRARLHAATMTGILDRLERGGWVTRERDPADRRAVTIHALRDRAGELIRLFGGMNGAMDALCDDYTEEQLTLIGEFLRRTAGAGHESAEKLATD